MDISSANKLQLNNLPSTATYQDKHLFSKKQKPSIPEDQEKLLTTMMTFKDDRRYLAERIRHCYEMNDAEVIEVIDATMYYLTPYMLREMYTLTIVNQIIFSSNGSIQTLDNPKYAKYKDKCQQIISWAIEHRHDKHLETAYRIVMAKALIYHLYQLPCMYINQNGARSYLGLSKFTLDLTDQQYTQLDMKLVEQKTLSINTNDNALLEQIRKATDSMCIMVGEFYDKELNLAKHFLYYLNKNNSGDGGYNIGTQQLPPCSTVESVKHFANDEIFKLMQNGSYPCGITQLPPEDIFGRITRLTLFDGTRIEANDLKDKVYQPISTNGTEIQRNFVLNSDSMETE